MRLRCGFSGGQRRVRGGWNTPIGAARLIFSLAILFGAGVPAVAQDAETLPQDISESDDEEVGLGTGSESALTIDGLIIARSKLDDVPFTGAGFNSGTVTPFVRFGARDLDGDDVSFGARATLRGDILDQPVEISAFFMAPMLNEGTRINLGNENGAADPNTNAIYDTENDPGGDIDSGNSENIYAMTVRHQTQLFGGEINVVKPFGIPGLLFGPRAIYFGEELGSATMKNTNDVPGGSDSSPDRDQVSVSTDNWLLGFQAGLQGMFNLSDDLRIGGSVKAGLYDNVVTRRRTFFALNVTNRVQDSTEKDDVLAYAVEVNPRIELRVADGVFLSAAGNFLWLDNVSEATSHFAIVTDLDDRDARANGDVFFYGGSLGLTMELDTLASSSAFGDGSPSLLPDGPAEGASLTELEERIAELESSTARKGNSKVSFEVSGWINRMIMGWDDGAESDAYIVDNVASRSRLEFNGAAKIARGWSAGYYLSLGLDDIASNDVDQLNSAGEEQIEVRHSAWWVRSNKYGTVRLGRDSTATDNIILSDLGGIMPGAQNIATIGGGFFVRLADEPETGNNALVTRTTLNDFTGGASVDTLRRNVIAFDAPRFSGLWGNLDLSAAWGEDDFYDVAARYSINWNDIRFRMGVGYLRDTTEGNQPGGNTGSRDREEYKGSASVLHVPSGLFATAAYVQRQFNGTNTSDQAIFGEVTTGNITPDGTNRPDLHYLYTAGGFRKRYTWLGETSIYGEWAQVNDAITGLNEAGQSTGTREVTESQVEMVGAAMSQNIDAAGIDLYAGFRHYSFEATGIRLFAGNPRAIPEPLTDINFAYGGVRIKF
jgi:hypothetical protein